MKLDIWFVIMCLTLFIIMILDMSVTIYALNLGFTEGNFLMKYLFEEIGIRATAIIYFLMTFFIFITFVFLRGKIIDENKIRMYYTLISLLISFRVFIIGAWYGSLATNISGGPF